PQAINAISVGRWKEWLIAKGFTVDEHQRDEDFTTPCAHLIKKQSYYHWIYQDETGIHDPDPKFMYVSPELITLDTYYPEGRVLTISVRTS
ncbi:MAG: hypothetical protein ABSE87_11355, partial [Terracidiphilus sp.]